MWSTIGQDHLLRPLSVSLQAGRLAHAYLLTGPPHVGKMTLAIDLAAAVNCIGGGDAGAGPCGECTPCARIGRGVHTDVRVVSLQQREAGQPTRTRIGIDEIREAMQATNRRSVEGGWTVIIFDGAETFSPEAANALLKTLEEPPDQVLILLLTANEDAILPTVRSRCRLLPLRPMGGATLTEFLVDRHGVETYQARWLSRIARGCPGWAISVLADPTILEERAEALDFIAASATTPLDERFAYANSLAGVYSRDRETARQTLFLWQRWWRDLLMVKEDASDHVQNTDRLAQLTGQAGAVSTADIVHFLRRIQETLAALDSNANPRLALECLMLAIPAA